MVVRLQKIDFQKPHSLSLFLSGAAVLFQTIAQGHSMQAHSVSVHVQTKNMSKKEGFLRETKIILAKLATEMPQT